MTEKIKRESDRLYTNTQNVSINMYCKKNNGETSCQNTSPYMRANFRGCS